MDVDLASSTIGAIREFIDSQSSRADLKSLALSAGAKAGRVMKIKISGNMRRPVHLDLSRYPHLPQPFVAATRSADYATLLAGGAGHG